MKTVFKGTILTHTQTSVKFAFVRVEKLQFTNKEFAVLLNLKSGKEERFLNNTYLSFFTV